MGISADGLRNLALKAMCGLVGGTVSLITGQFVLAYCEELGWFDNPTGKVQIAMNWLSALLTAVVHNIAFQIGASLLVGLSAGFAAGVWLDALLRRREAEGKEGLVASTEPVSQSVRTEPSFARLPVVAEEGVSPPRGFLEARDGEREARPQLKLSMLIEPGRRHDGQPTTRVLGVATNCTSSFLKECVVSIHSIERDGELKSVGRQLAIGEGRSFAIPPKGRRRFVLASRAHAAAPPEPVRVKLAPDEFGALLGDTDGGEMLLEDHSVYTFNLEALSDGAVMTRAVVEVAVIEYDVMVVALQGQASWRPQ